MFKKLFFNSDLTILLISLSAIIFALYVQFELNFAPCKLCFWQRYPYYALILLSFLRVMNVKIDFHLQLLAISANILFASYHMLIENAILPAPLNCASSVDMTVLMDPADLLEKIKKTKATSCAQIPFTIFGLSMTGWNLLLNFAMMIYMAFVQFQLTLKIKV